MPQRERCNSTCRVDFSACLSRPAHCSAPAASLMSLEIKLKRSDRVYVPGETVKGVVVVDSPKGTTSHSGLSLLVRGQITSTPACRSMGVPDYICQAARPVSLLNVPLITMAAPGKFPEGRTEIPFEFALESPAQTEESLASEEATGPPSAYVSRLLESYHGVMIEVTYELKVELNRGTFNKNWTNETEFFIHTPRKKPVPPKPVQLKLTRDELKNVRGKDSLPEFSILGSLSSALCNVNTPLEGEVIVVQSAEPIRTIEVQLIRVETLVSSVEGTSVREATEIQNIQIADGDVSRNLSIPIHMIFPRIFTCSSFKTPVFAVEFEINVVVVFASGLQITENVPVKLYRL